MIPLLFMLGFAAGDPGDGPSAGAPWSFAPLGDPTPPAVRDEAWVRSPIDRFILARLEDAGIPAPAEADRRTLIRRVTLDLSGLPPSPEEVEAFVADDAPGAWERVVDRLLASPRYGERIGRHWLDVARYADSNGLDENIAHGNAWRYRDWVVRAFNRDEPYDRFIRAQIAGDLMPAADHASRVEQLIATGFLSLGPKVLAEGDLHKLEMDIIDEQIDTLGKALIGLALGCARCHEHKFDPIATEDYYALAGIFKSTRTMESLARIARWHENPLATADEIEAAKARAAEIAALEAEIQKLEKDAGESGKAALASAKESLSRRKESAVELPAAMGVTEGEVSDVAVHIRGESTNLGPVVERAIPAALRFGEDPDFAASRSGRLELAAWLARPDHPLTARVIANRIWRWHFGRGLAGTPDNFGRTGERPTHPELLDWLARRFVDGGWSIKRLEREILCSSSYRMASAFDAEAAERDPENRLRWRFDVRRLDAEAIRDSLLAVAGLLDLEVGGSLLHVANREFLFDHTSKDTTSYDSLRRSIYLPVIRNNVYDAFALFDFPDPAVVDGDRRTTTVASQALFLMNSELALRASDALAASLLTAESRDEARVRRLWTLAYAREPSASETERALGFVRRAEAALPRKNSAPDRVEAWAMLCQVTLLANEFLYVR